MSKGEETRRMIIERAAPLFNTRGFHGCSMSDIMEATGLEKGGIYRHFSSKEEIAEAAFYYAVESTVKLQTSGIPVEGSPLAVLRAWIGNFVTSPSGLAGGCPLMNTAIDTDDGNEVLRGLVRKAFQTWRGRIVALLESSLAAGEIATGTDVVWLANTVIMTLEGALMLSRIERRREPLLHAQRTLDLLLDGVASPS